MTDPSDIAVPDFDAVYTANQDPYGVASTFYERRKLQIVAAVLAKSEYDAAWDPACGTGHLALELAGRCGSVLATDGSPVAVQIARAHCGADPAITFDTVLLPTAPTTSTRFDLIALAEFMYYLDPDDRAASLSVVERCAAPQSEVVAVHWRHHPHDAHLSGADVQTEIVTHLTRIGWRHHLHLDDPSFVLDTVILDSSGR